MIPGLCSAFFSRSGRPVGSFSAITDVPFVQNGGRGTFTSSPITASPIGGVAPFTYAWSKIAGDQNMTIDSPAAASTTGTNTVLYGDNTDTYCVCTITDNTGAVAVTPSVVFVFVWNF